MTNKEAKRILQFCIPMKTDKQREAIACAVKALEDVERLEEENHSNFVNSQHIISMLVEEIKKLRGEEE